MTFLFFFFFFFFFLLIHDLSPYHPHPTHSPCSRSPRLIGVALSIVGNLLISLALNLQKLAHQRILTLSSPQSKHALNHPISESSPLNDHHPHPSVPLPHRAHHDLSYLSSPIWWTGFILMSAGELGNFISYGFAPASVVAPLGTVALIGNCVMAPIILGEHFKRRDGLGISLAIIGTITIVLSSPRHSEALEPDPLLLAISQLGFILYASLCLSAILFLAFLSNTPWADQFIGIDVGLCAISGGFTVLSTKAFSSLLNLMFLDCFNYSITWFMLVVMLVTAILQIIFLNRALQRFDSKHVVPVQFVLFTIMAVVGSTTLYGDFKNLSSAQVGNFVFACGFIFTGVYILTRDGSSVEQPTYRERREFRSMYHSPTLTPVLEESLESSDLAESIVSRTIEPRDSMRIEGSSVEYNPFSESNRFTSPTSWKSLQFSFSPPNARVLRRQRSQPILFPRAFGTPGYYLIANSSTSRSLATYHGFPDSG